MKKYILLTLFTTLITQSLTVDSTIELGAEVETSISGISETTQYIDPLVKTLKNRDGLNSYNEEGTNQEGANQGGTNQEDTGSTNNTKNSNETDNTVKNIIKETIVRATSLNPVIKARFDIKEYNTYFKIDKKTIVLESPYVYVDNNKALVGFDLVNKSSHRLNFKIGGNFRKIDYLDKFNTNNDIGLLAPGYDEVEYYKNWEKADIRDIKKGHLDGKLGSIRAVGLPTGALYGTSLNKALVKSGLVSFMEVGGEPAEAAVKFLLGSVLSNLGDGLKAFQNKDELLKVIKDPVLFRKFNEKIIYNILVEAGLDGEGKDEDYVTKILTVSTIYDLLSYGFNKDENSNTNTTNSDSSSNNNENSNGEASNNENNSSESNSTDSISNFDINDYRVDQAEYEKQKNIDVLKDGLNAIANGDAYKSIDFIIRLLNDKAGYFEILSHSDTKKMINAISANNSYDFLAGIILPKSEYQYNKELLSKWYNDNIWNDKAKVKSVITNKVLPTIKLEYIYEPLNIDLLFNTELANRTKDENLKTTKDLSSTYTDSNISIIKSGYSKDDKIEPVSLAYESSRKQVLNTMKYTFNFEIDKEFKFKLGLDYLYGVNKAETNSRYIYNYKYSALKSKGWFGLNSYYPAEDKNYETQSSNLLEYSKHYIDISTDFAYSFKVGKFTIIPELEYNAKLNIVNTIKAINMKDNQKEEVKVSVFERDSNNNFIDKESRESIILKEHSKFIDDTGNVYLSSKFLTRNEALVKNRLIKEYHIIVPKMTIKYSPVSSFDISYSLQLKLGIDNNKLDSVGLKNSLGFIVRF